MKLRILLISLLTVCLFNHSKADNLGFSKYNPLRVGLDLDYAPMEYVDKDGLPRGLDVKLTQRLLKRLDIPYTYCPNNWENISGDVINSRVDLGMMVYSPYRKNIVNYSRAVMRLYYQIVFRVTDTENLDMRDLAGKEVAYMSSRPVTDTLQRAGAVLNVVRDLPKALKELSEGRYDAVICFRYQAQYHIKDMQLDNLKAADMTLMPREYCYVSTNHKLIRTIDRELAKMEEEGIIEDIYGEYIAHVGKFFVPHWVWYTLGVLALLFLAVIVVLQHNNAGRLKHEMERAQQSERLKGIFLANISHALRTPLNAIIGFSDVMRTTDENELSAADRKQLTEHIHSNGQQLLYFINELLQLSDIEGNGLQYQRVEADIREVMESYCRELRPKLHEGVALNIEAPAKNFTAIVDLSLLRQVTMHLLTNAIRHTKEGSITISYKHRGKGLYVRVADTGEGLNEKLKNNIFTLLHDKNTFVQDENPGLGLSICKAIIDASHGQISVESEEGQGATFWFWVPCEVRE